MTKRETQLLIDTNILARLMKEDFKLLSNSDKEMAANLRKIIGYRMLKDVFTSKSEYKLAIGETRLEILYHYPKK